MNLFDLLKICGRYDALIQIGYKGKKSGIMKVGNITYKQLDHFCFRKRVLSVFPCCKGNKNFLFVNLVDE